MGADIHVFVEVQLPGHKRYVNTDYYRRYTEGDTVGYERKEAFEGRYAPLFDILRHKVPQNGYPKLASEVFEMEWNSWEGCGVYGLNYISLRDLYKFWNRELIKEFISLKEDLEFSNTHALYLFLNDIVQHYLLFIKHEGGVASLADKIGGNIYVIYFFDR